jgi:hypothetical protein
MKKALFGARLVSFPLIALFHPCYRFARALFGGLRESARGNQPEAGIRRQKILEI